MIPKMPKRTTVHADLLTLIANSSKSDPVQVCLKDSVVTLMLNRPDRRNALNVETITMLRSSIELIARDDKVKAVVLTGAGDAFCSGADINELAGGELDGPHRLGLGGGEALRRGFKEPHDVILGLFEMEKPVIAAINGSAVGAGLDLACACDIRLASPDAKFSAAYVKIGLFPGYGGAWFYPRYFGMARAAKMVFTGDFISSDEALRSGFLCEIIPSEQLYESAKKLANKIAQGPPIALRLSKLMMRQGLSMDLRSFLEISSATESITLSSNDHSEALMARRHKRKPKFSGV